MHGQRAWQQVGDSCALSPGPLQTAIGSTLCPARSSAPPVRTQQTRVHSESWNSKQPYSRCWARAPNCDSSHVFARCEARAARVTAQSAPTFASCPATPLRSPRPGAFRKKAIRQAGGGPVTNSPPGAQTGLGRERSRSGLEICRVNAHGIRSSENRSEATEMPPTPVVPGPEDNTAREIYLK